MLPIGVDINNLIDDLRIFSWEARDIFLYYSKILKNPRNDIELLINKNNNDPVTMADLEVNDFIITKIREKYADVKWSILSEENVKDGAEKIIINKYKWLWVFDPLDGTKDFIQGTGNYAMHLALNYKNEPFIGVVLIPEQGELWISNGSETWCETNDGSVKEPRILKNKILQNMTIVTSKNHGNKTLKNLIDKINFKKVNIMGSIGCKIASIIRGENDLYLSLSLPGQSSPKDWDFAAPAAILKSAGGAITNLQNEEISFNKPNYEQGGIVIASNNKVNHRLICVEIKKIIDKYNIYPFEN